MTESLALYIAQWNAFGLFSLDLREFKQALVHKINSDIMN